MRRVSAIVLAAVFMFTVAAVAQNPPGMPKPAPELKKLDYFTGTWSFDGDMKPSPFGPGGKFSGTEKWEWMPGNFFLVSHSDMKGAMGDVTGLGIMGYSSDDKKFTYSGYNSMGEAESAMGNLDGDTWNWNNETKMGKGRYSMKILSPTSYSFKFEMSKDGSDWSTVMEGKAVKQ